MRELTSSGHVAIHALLSRLFLRELDATLVQELSRPSVAGVLDELEPGFAADVSAPWDDARLDDEAAEFARLFLIPGGVSPYAAAWIDGDEGAVRADLGRRISALYDVLAVRPIEFGLGNVPADHIGMLLALTSAAWQRDPSGATARHCFELYEDWGRRFAQQVASRSTSSVYRASGQLLYEVLGFAT